VFNSFHKHVHSYRHFIMQFLYSFPCHISSLPRHASFVLMFTLLQRVMERLVAHTPLAPMHLNALAPLSCLHFPRFPLLIPALHFT